MFAAHSGSVEVDGGDVSRAGLWGQGIL